MDDRYRTFIAFFIAYGPEGVDASRIQTHRKCIVSRFRLRFG
jgi:hypothetical protein